MLYGLAGQVDMSTADWTLVDPIVTDAAAEIAATTPAVEPSGLPASPTAGTAGATQQAAGAPNTWPILALGMAVGAWYWWHHGRHGSSPH
jgi:hypothetical protein